MARKSSRQPKKSHVLPYGSGSFYYADKSGLWTGAVSVGWSSSGAPKRATVSDVDEQRAWDKLTALRKKIAAGKWVAKSAPTVKTWAADWLANIQPYQKPQGYAQHVSHVDHWIIPAIGTKRVDRLTPADVRDVAQAIISAGRKPATARAVHSTLHTMLQAALTEGYDVPRPVLAVRRPAAGQSGRTAIPIADALTLMTEISGRPDGSRWVAALLQGMRQGECLGLTWECVDLQRHRIDVAWQLVELKYADKTAKTIEVPPGYEVRQIKGVKHLARPKSAKGRRSIPMVPWMEQSLRAWRESAPANPWGLVWPDASGKRPRDLTADRDAWRELQAICGVSKPDGSPYVLHEARDTAASLLLAAGIPIEVTEEILGHSTAAMSRSYQTVFEDQVKDALTKSAALLGLTVPGELSTSNPAENAGIAPLSTR